MVSILYVFLVSAFPADSASQAEQLLRVVSYDRNLGARTPDGLRLAVLHDPKVQASGEEAERFLAEVTALARAGSKLAPESSATIAFSNGDVLFRTLVAQKISALYVASGLSPSLAEVVRAAEEAGVMTLSGGVADVAGGLAAGVSETRKVVINIGAAERCGVDFDPVVRQVAQRVGETSPDPDRLRLAGTLARYREAIRTKDIDELRALWPSLTNQEATKVQSSMKGVESHDVSLALLRIEPDGARVRVRVRRADRLLTREGETLVSGRLMEIFFRQSEAGVWVIDSMTGV